MPSGSVNCQDSRQTVAGGSTTGWSWPTDWEWIGMTAICLGTSESVTLNVTSVSSDSTGKRNINFNLTNNTGNTTEVFLTKTWPNFSVD
jgi:hypothetical protein